MSLSTSHAAVRSSSLPRHFKALDGWRGVAALLVLFHHTGFFLRYGLLAVAGFTGVHLFFVLSGYLLYQPLCKAMKAGTPFGFGDFYIRRALRIYPAYLLALVVYSVARYATHEHVPTARTLWTHVFMVFNSANPREFFGINGAFWTLAIESQFYVLLPIIATLVYRLVRHPTRAIFATPLFCVAIGLICRGAELSHTTGPGMPDGPVIRFHLVYSFLDLFGAGMLVTAMESRISSSWILGRWTARGLFFAGAALFLAANAWARSLGSPDWMLVNNFWFSCLFPTILCAGAAAVLFVVVRYDGFPRSILSFRPLVYVGQISYSVYLFHILVELPLFSIFPLGFIHNYTVRTFAWGLIALGPTLLVATAVYYLVEAPFLRISARFKRGLVIVSPPTAPASDFQPAIAGDPPTP
jgi:peptidoglycan/LPS O-acetylase OafA/YrhL